MPKITKAKGATNKALYNVDEPSATTEQAESQPVATEPAETAERPNKSATRDEWNAYAEAVGVENAADLANKDAVIDAVDELEG